MAMMALAALWGIADVLRGVSGPEDLMFAVPLLMGCIAMAIMLAWPRRPRTGHDAIPPLDPIAVAQRIWRIAKWTMLTVSLLITLATVVWAVRSGTFWMPVLIGAFALAGTCTIMTIVLRPKARH
jgi:hypothetical protein